MKNIKTMGELFESLKKGGIVTNPYDKTEELEVLTGEKTYKEFGETTEYDLPEPDGTEEKAKFIGVRVKGGDGTKFAMNVADFK